MKRVLWGLMFAVILSFGIGCVGSVKTVYADTTEDGRFEFQMTDVRDENGEPVEVVRITKYLGNDSVVDIPNEIEGKAVTEIDQNAFRHAGVNHTMKEIHIPKGVVFNSFEMIKVSNPFDYCVVLEKIEVDPENEKYLSENGIFFNKDKTEILAYPAGKNDRSYKIPAGVTSIKSSTFSNCGGLAELQIPDSVNNIEDGAFSDCTSMASILVDSGNKTYTSDEGVLFDKEKTKIIFYPVGKTEKTYHIPDGVVSIGGNAFSGCSNLTEIQIPDSVTSIGSYAFSNCSSLEKLQISNNISEIENYVFSGCTSLQEIQIPNKVTGIGNYAFLNCSSLTELQIPENVTSIGYSAFSDCASIAHILVEPGNKIYASEGGVLFNKEKTKIILYPAGNKGESYTVPKNVTSIESNAFYNCAFLAEILVSSGNNVYASENGVLFNKEKTELIVYPAGKKEKTYKVPEGALKIKRDAFSGCSNLESVEICEGVTEIGSIFQGCSSLKEVRIPASVTYIGEKMVKASVANIFEGCEMLKNIQVDPENKDYASENGVLYNKDKTRLYVYPWGKTEDMGSLGG